MLIELQPFVRDPIDHPDDRLYRACLDPMIVRVFCDLVALYGPIDVRNEQSWGSLYFAQQAAARLVPEVTLRPVRTVEDIDAHIAITTVKSMQGRWEGIVKSWTPMPYIFVFDGARVMRIPLPGSGDARAMLQIARRSLAQSLAPQKG